ncbi:N-acetyl-gamma-glutamyl-phosphate reductase [Marinihelvus fidelis]|uniref:N-acetyl-gamma-glutamyl-phosphate reductase n=2 Tax=Marinihelvus fidelis TaxID=2613842 RepID=A0A5N0T750_9GAMM|nr:N-acetyl-gamma-glutamyl-phosphate reductase [Marinihelvus fidelis]
MTRSVALVGGRGYTGAELLGLLARHPVLKLAFASSTSQAGLPVTEVCPQWPDANDQLVALSPGEVATGEADAWVLAVPNGAAAEWAQAISAAHPTAVIIDLSADHRFDDDWAYGLPELNRAAIRQAKRIANPGCYATAGQLGLAPIADRLAGTPSLFGVSGYSGAGRTPSPKNDPERLADNLLPYSLAGHVHEREIGHRLGRPVRFMPHVAPFFRGIAMTISARLGSPTSAAELEAIYREAYAGERRIRVSREAPEVRDMRDTPDAAIGGFTVSPDDPHDIAVVSVLDNLSKGAASQALQNINLALGLDEQLGLEP